MSTLHVTPAAELAGRRTEELLGPAAPNGDELPEECYLLLRNTGPDHRRVTVPAPSGRITVTVRKRQTKTRPTDMLIGPVGPGEITYQPDAQGLQVAAHTFARRGIPQSPPGE